MTHNTPSGGVPTAARAIKGNLLIFAATLFFGINIPVVKLLAPEWMTTTDITVFRLMGGAVLFWLASSFVLPDRIDRHDFPRILLGGGVGLFLFIYLFNLALKYASPIDVSIILTLPPVIVILIHMLFMKLRPSGLEVAGVVVAFVGAAVVILGNSAPGAKAPNPLLGNILAIASCICYAVYLVVLEKPTHKYRPVSLLRWVFLAAAVPCIALLPHMPQARFFHEVSWPAIGYIAFIVTCPTFLAYLMINPAIKYIGSELVSLYQYLIPVVATIGSVVTGVATLHTMQVVAMVIIIGGMVMTNMAGRRKRLAAAKASAVSVGTGKGK